MSQEKEQKNVDAYIDFLISQMKEIADDLQATVARMENALSRKDDEHEQGQ